MILETINNKLLEVDANTFYGAVDPRMKNTVWDYIVFNRSVMKPNTNRTSFTDYFVVNIIREGWIPEGLELEVINKMLEIDGMRLASSDARYSYTTKPNTSKVIEVLSIEFCRAKKAA